ncbi:hypothetical protein J437_LFUL006134 [Ladona fulva]|uniref:FGFR1 oncogene partner (FOP) N-terminal dimerisation domain-containing protein n=1 Tax=Ladona fulva TaxID=123851 RepID=A0A8K0K090_LADFU|nr:hypothetical protein J437_LFUL006134 [Ladona fulva]
MSELRAEEGITELRDLVAQTLEKNGALAKIKAELRASVFLALEEQESIENKAPFFNQPLKDFLSTSEGELISCLVREFLEYFHLDFTLSVFDQETYHQKEYHYMGREKLCRNLKINKTDVNGPVLADVLQLASREDFSKPNGNHCNDDSMSIEEQQNSHSDSSTGNRSSQRLEKDPTKGVETITVTVQPKSRIVDEKEGTSTTLTGVVSNERKLNVEDEEVKESPISSDEHRGESRKSKSENAVSSPLPEGELKTAFDNGVYDEEFQSYASGTDVKEENSPAKGASSPPVTEEIEEEIPSMADDPLSSNVSVGEDTTIDMTISDPTGVANYMEEL